MRINRFIARATGLSRRAADQAVAGNRVTVNGRPATLGTDVGASDIVTLDGDAVRTPEMTVTIALHKPVGYICSRAGQGSRTVYDLLPAELHHLKSVGRLDKDSSGLLLLTSDGDLANRLTHPRYAKEKVYEVSLDRALARDDRQRLGTGVQLEDGTSNLHVEHQDGTRLTVVMHEGRNRQIRRTFQALGYRVTRLHRTRFGAYNLDGLEKPGAYRTV
jgi:23S rRNA pseudouridine2605 synthase